MDGNIKLSTYQVRGETLPPRKTQNKQPNKATKQANEYREITFIETYKRGGILATQMTTMRSQGVKYKMDLPTVKYRDRKLKDPMMAIKTIYQIDTRDADKLKCFVMIRELFDCIPGMPEIAQQCRDNERGSSSPRCNN